MTGQVKSCGGLGGGDKLIIDALWILKISELADGDGDCCRWMINQGESVTYTRKLENGT